MGEVNVHSSKSVGCVVTRYKIRARKSWVYANFDSSGPVVFEQMCAIVLIFTRPNLHSRYIFDLQFI